MQNIRIISLRVWKRNTKFDKVDATEESRKLGNPRVFNLIVLGIAAQHMDFTKEQWYEVIEKTVPPKTIEINKKALRLDLIFKYICRERRKKDDQTAFSICGKRAGGV